MLTKFITLTLLVLPVSLVNAELMLDSATYSAQNYRAIADVYCKNSTFNANTIDLSSTINCTGNNQLNFDTLTGDGTIRVESGKTVIYVNHLLFHGTIECDGECIIKTAQEAKDIAFVKKGKGSIMINEE